MPSPLRLGPRAGLQAFCLWSKKTGRAFGLPARIRRGVPLEAKFSFEQTLRSAGVRLTIRLRAAISRRDQPSNDIRRPRPRPEHQRDGIRQLPSVEQPGPDQSGRYGKGWRKAPGETGAIADQFRRRQPAILPLPVRRDAGADRYRWLSAAAGIRRSRSLWSCNSATDKPRDRRPHRSGPYSSSKDGMLAVTILDY